MLRAHLALAALALSATACPERSPAADQSTPEAAVRSFFAALAAGRLPDELERFVLDEGERAAWQLRCELDGCARGTIARLRPGETLAWRATVLLDYSVRGRDDIIVMSGRDAPVALEREGEVWKIREFGPQTRLRIGDPDRAAVTSDGGVPAAAGATRD